MDKITVKARQSLFDIALIYLGSADATYALAVQNGLSITDEIEPGTEIELIGVVNKNVVNYYNINKIAPACATTELKTSIIPDVVYTTTVGRLFGKKSVKVLGRQSLFDIAIQHLGSADGAYALAQKNNISLTDELTPGMELELTDVINKEVVSYYSNKRIVPATGESIAESTVVPEGIGYWSIGYEFIVS